MIKKSSSSKIGKQETSSKKRYALVGTGSRAVMFAKAFRETYKKAANLVMVCDSNVLRAENWLKYNQLASVPVYAPDEFSTALKKNKVDTVIVTTVDRTHHHYICEAMRQGCDVITEKPMTTDVEKCREILSVQRETGRSVDVTFNYRYSPRNSKVKEILDSGVIGEVNSVHFEWLLDTKHGADYFRRWHREKINSGGLLVHKATHHFDLVNWWLGTHPVEVCAFGGLRFYGRVNRERHGFGRDFVYSTGNPKAQGDPYAIHLDDEEGFGRKVYLEPAEVDGYRRDQNPFGDGISVEDDMAVLVRYANQATLSYHLTAYSPWEGYRVMFNGTKGRLEYEVTERPYISATEEDHHFATHVQGATKLEIREPLTLLLRLHWEPVQSIPFPFVNHGGHGGGDVLMLEEIFHPEKRKKDPLHRYANQVAGAWSILTGIAGNLSMEQRRIVRIEEFGLSDFLETEDGTAKNAKNTKK